MPYFPAGFSSTELAGPVFLALPFVFAVWTMRKDAKRPSAKPLFHSQRLPDLADGSLLRLRAYAASFRIASGRRRADSARHKEVR
jgi:hypothetical protein